MRTRGGGRGQIASEVPAVRGLVFRELSLWGLTYVPTCAPSAELKNWSDALKKRPQVVTAPGAQQKQFVGTNRQPGDTTRVGLSPRKRVTGLCPDPRSKTLLAVISQDTEEGSMYFSGVSCKLSC